MRDQIKELANQLYDDVQKLRSDASEEISQRVGTEIMALNAISNAYNTLREKE